MAAAKVAAPAPTSSASAPAGTDPRATHAARLGEAAPPSEIEAKVIAYISERLGERMAAITPSTLIRFVRGFAKTENRNDTTLKCVDAYLKFRVESKVDEVARTVYPRIDEFNSQWQSGVHGISKTGHVIYVQRLGKIDANKIWKNFTFDEVRNFHIQEMEHLVAAKEALSRQYGQMTYKHVCIMDLDGVGMGHFGQSFREPIKQVLNIDQNMYPETLHIMVITNYSLVFKAIWKIVSPWIDPLTKARILWGKEELVKWIDKDQLPQFLGGKCKCVKCLVSPFVAGDGAKPLPSVEVKAGAATPGETIYTPVVDATPIGIDIAAAPSAASSPPSGDDTSSTSDTPSTTTGDTITSDDTPPPVAAAAAATATSTPEGVPEPTVIATPVTAAATAVSGVAVTETA